MRIFNDSVLEGIEGVTRCEMYGGRLKNVVGPLQNFVQDFRIAPDFGVERRAARIENADDFPVPAAQVERVAQFHARVCFRRVLADNQLCKPRLEHAALIQFYEGPDGEHVW